MVGPLARVARAGFRVTLADVVVQRTFAAARLTDDVLHETGGERRALAEVAIETRGTVTVLMGAPRAAHVTESLGDGARDGGGSGNEMEHESLAGVVG